MDIRVQRTRLAIESAFLKLLAHKPAARITVTEICRLSDINRATFYKHYLDIMDLQASMEADVLEDFQAVFRDSLCRDGSHRPILVELLTYLKNNGNRFTLLCSGNAESELPFQVFQLTQAQVFPLMAEKLPGQNPQYTELMYRFLTRGCGALLVSWLRGECIMTAEEMADFMLKICSAAVIAVADSPKES